MGQPSLADVTACAPAARAVPPVPGLERLWRETVGDPEVVVAVLDGPVDLSHPCFESTRLEVLGYTDAPETGQPPGGLAALHGTHVASLLFGRHGGPVAGIAPGCRGLIVPVFRTDSLGAVVPCSQLDLARAITLAVTSGARIINISGGQLDETGEPEPVLGDVLRLCADEDVLVVAAAGNDGRECLQLPAADPHVLVVGAMDAQGEPLVFSNWSDDYRPHGVLAPGDRVVGAVPGGGTLALSGTSVATAIVSGVAALLMCIQRKRTRQIDAGAVRRAILDSAIGCDELPARDCPRVLSGRLHVPGALAQIVGEAPITKGSQTAMGEHTPQSGQTQEGLPESRMASSRENGAEDSEALVAGNPPVPRRASIAGSPDGRPALAGTAVAPATAPDGGCACACPGNKPGPLVYALGLIDYDFGTEANRDGFVQQGLEHPDDAAGLLEYLDGNPAAAESVIWLLAKETTPLYAIRPRGPFGVQAYERLRGFLRAQLDEGVSQVSIPGILVGEVTLLNGHTVPVVAPDLRGMCCWCTLELCAAVLGPRPARRGREQTNYDRQVVEIANFLDRVYYELNNLGLASQDRAINCAATNAWQAATAYQRALHENMRLDAITAERSRVCRPGADCWDVKLVFFDPSHRLERARVVHRFTVDVSEVLPVTVGRVRSWETY